MSLKIALIGDLHYGFPEEEDMEEYLEPVVREMVDNINEFSPQVVIGMGDFIQHSDRETDLESMEKVGELLSDLDSDFHAIPGNHDPITISKEEMIEKLSPQNDSPFFSLEIGNTKIICLDTVRKIGDIHDAGMLGKRQRQWMEDEMDSSKEVLVFSHHLLHYCKIEGNWFFDEFPELAFCVDKKQFNEVKGDNLRAVFSAHIHEEGIESFRGVPHFTTSGMDKFNPPDRFEENHALITIDDEIEFEGCQQNFSV